MNDYENEKARNLFSRLFVLAVDNKINLDAFTNLLEKSDFVRSIERNQYNTIYEKSLEELFFMITGFNIDVDNSYGIYNDAYWCGQSYFDLRLKLNKSFAYLFLKLPFSKMMDLYLIFHEMDFSSLREYFENREKEKTILRLLCEKKKCSLNDISKETGISLSTLKKYNSSDEYIYNSSFSNVVKIADYFNAPYQLFLK